MLHTLPAILLVSLLCHLVFALSSTITPVPSLTEEQYNQLRSQLLTVRDFIPQENTTNNFCGTSLIDQNITPEAAHFHQHHVGMDANAVCTLSHSCDTLSHRDTFYSPHAYIYRFNLEFIIINDGSNFYNTVDTRVSVLVFELNQFYSAANIQFTASVIKADVLNVGQTVYYIGEPACSSSGSQPCYNAKTVVMNIMQQRRTSWKLKGTFQILMANFQTVGLNGYAYFPWSSDSGLVVLSQNVFQSGFSTLSHELGHAFGLYNFLKTVLHLLIFLIGLYHTFRGISEISSCSDPCYESTASSLTGDLCGDTAPVARNWECTTATLSTSSYPDSCNSGRRFWTGADQSNFMAYNNNQLCRRRFTEHQNRRMRCYASTLTNDITVSPNNHYQLQIGVLPLLLLALLLL